MSIKEKRKFVFDKIGAFLRAAGFRKRANNFYKRNGELCYCVNLQNDKWNYADKMRFTINFGIYTDEFYLKHYDYHNTGKVPTFPIELYCVVRRRIGELLPNPHDKWWTISDDSYVTKILADIEQDITNYGLPFFDKYKSPVDIIPDF